MLGHQEQNDNESLQVSDSLEEAASRRHACSRDDVGITLRRHALGTCASHHWRQPCTSELLDEQQRDALIAHQKLEEQDRLEQNDNTSSPQDMHAPSRRLSRSLRAPTIKHSTTRLDFMQFFGIEPISAPSQSSETSRHIQVCGFGPALIETRYPYDTKHDPRLHRILELLKSWETTSISVQR